jgi:formate hydrogenlyase subunit 6/NADH:ubiquinone oxidoreductase subunit I
LIIPAKVQEYFYLKYFPVKEWNENIDFYSPIRTSQPLKSFFYAPQEKVAEYPAKEKEAGQPSTRVIIASKACDIHALKIIDKVYLEGDYPDPGYAENRKNNIIISSDCTDAGEFCSCTLMNYKPYPEKDFDLNLSQLDDFYLVEIGSEKGQEIFTTYFSGSSEATEDQIQKRNRLREEITGKVKKVNEKFRYYRSHQESIQKHLNSNEWHSLSKTCVECGTCTQICPTCHCFLLYDQPLEEKFERIKVWDSCFFAGYSRMAGGLTPRLSLADRFKNRFYHKFDSFVTNFGVEACTGCGRCSEGCMGKIDLREVLMELEKRVVLKEYIDLV